MKDNVILELPFVLQDLYHSVRDLPVGPEIKRAPRSTSQSNLKTRDTGPAGRS
jgi:hypothetical protein